MNYFFNTKSFPIKNIVIYFIERNNILLILFNYMTYDNYFFCIAFVIRRFIKRNHSIINFCKTSKLNFD